MKLKELYIDNFKGFKDFNIKFEDKETKIIGDNATGKTTIFDAYTWLLWDKDSLNRKNFEIKPLDKNNQVIHGLESTVTGLITHDDRDIKLTKIFKEIWTKKRGQLKETFTGHTTDYYINDVPVKKSEYNSRVSEIADEDEFNLLSNPLYFNEILDKNQRRDVLLSLIKDVDSTDVIKANEELEDLDIENYTIDEIKSMAKATAKKINEEIKEIPARIDELNNSKNTIQFKQVEINKNTVKKKIDEIDKAIASKTDTSKVVTDLNKKLQETLDEIREIRTKTDDENYELERELKKEYNKKIDEYLGKKSELESEHLKARRNLKREIETLELIEENMKLADKDLADLRKKWIEKKNEKFDGSLICPTCKRPLEEHDKKDILKNFEDNKLQFLNDLQADAKETQERKDDYEKDYKHHKELAKAQQSVLDNLIKSLENFEEFTEKEPEFKKKDYPKKYYDLQKDVEKIQDDIEKLAKDDNSGLLKEKERLQHEYELILSTLAKKGQNEEIDERIKKYLDSEKELARKYEEQQRIIYLTDEYIRTYTELVQDKINSLFSEVKFKLFDVQVNGGIVETCEATVNGIPYSSVNNAGKINAGLDIINTLSKHFNKQIPIFMDNAESITEPLEVESQIIKMYVVKGSKLKIGDQ